MFGVNDVLRLKANITNEVLLKLNIPELVISKIKNKNLTVVHIDENIYFNIDNEKQFGALYFDREMFCFPFSFFEKIN